MSADNHTLSELIIALSDAKDFSELNTEEEVGTIETEEDYKKRANQEKIHELRLANRLKEEELKSREQDRKQRKGFADKIFFMLSIFLLFVCLILVFAGMKFLPIKPYPHFELSDNVLIALLTTASANVIGIFIVVVRYLFPSQTK